MTKSISTIMVYNRKVLSSHATRLFKALDTRFEPRVLLIGVSFRGDGSGDAEIVSSDPTLYSEEFLRSAIERANELAGLSRADVLWEESQGVFELRQRLQAAVQALTLRINESPNSQGYRTLVSIPTQWGDFGVFVVLQLQREVCESYPELPIVSHSPGGEEGVNTRSLLGGAATRFLSAAQGSLWQPNPIVASLKMPSTAELLRLGARQFLFSVGWRVHSATGDCFGLYDSCCEIAALKHERREAMGRLILAKEDHPNLELLVELTPSVPLSRTRAVRKLVEVTSGTLALIANATSVIGLGIHSPDSTERDKGVFEIAFHGHGKWELINSNARLMTVELGNPSLVRPRISSDEVQSGLQEVFPDVSQRAINRLWSVVRAAVKQSHGTTIVVTGEAASNAERLRPGAIQIRETELRPDTVKAVSGIDGALLFDLSGCCHAIGVILDGTAQGEGDPARGARYNSAIRFVRSQKCPTYAVVVSEDGWVDVIKGL